ncbi:HAMP domain-containing histidine kinase [Catenovulum sp. SM1970]|uniref:sensor histidine kinase n=1 Tax=Marinifaba aquimaris TaxID=2741323 RepID=UPI001571A9FF|nr:ATP-binding protein [Marinifaba aquimaris]NTS77071.1 HAMP domain-containing histidine kinase [Marinifaba aquimaris]
MSFLSYVSQNKVFNSLPWLVLLAIFLTLVLSGAQLTFGFLSLSAGYALLLALLQQNKLQVLFKLNEETARLPALVCETLFYALLLNQYGGASNAAVSILYIPIVVAAVCQHKKVAWLIWLIAICVYSFLFSLFDGQSNEHANHHTNHNTVHHHMHHMVDDKPASDNQAFFNEHVLGMWLTFVFSSMLMNWFLTLQRQWLLNKEQQISELKEKQLRDEQILAVATTAANAAHALATPISAANLLIDEFKQSIEEADLTQADRFEFEDLTEELEEQIKRCQNSVQQISNQARSNQPEAQKNVNAADFIEQVYRTWWVTHNDIIQDLNIDPKVTQVQIEINLNLELSIINILENAARASLAEGCDKVKVLVNLARYHQQDYIEINVFDFGQGINSNILHSLGKKALGEDAQGMGLGLVLANATVERLGGKLCIQNTEQGALTQLRLPKVI